MNGRKERLISCAVLLAGGRGTRFWPRSRLRTPKQLLNITSRNTMLRATMERLLPVFGARNFWVVTNDQQAGAVRRELRGVPPSHVLAEPVGRNTAAAIGLAAIHLVRERRDALMAVLPSDSVIGKPVKYRELVREALNVARTPGNLVVLGIQPTRPETGYGYIEKGERAARLASARPYTVKRFTEKPPLASAEEYVASGNYLWNAGMFFWRASSFLENLKRFLPATHAAFLDLADTIGTRHYDTALRQIYPKLENISVDYAVMEPASRLQSGSANAAGAATGSRVIVIPASVGWSDIGSWAAVYEFLASAPGANVSAGPSLTLDSSGNYLWSPKKFIAAIGVRDLVLVETPDATLLCAREKSQEVGKIVKWLEEHKMKALL